MHSDIGYQPESRPLAANQYGRAMIVYPDLAL